MDHEDEPLLHVNRSELDIAITGSQFIKGRYQGFHSFSSLVKVAGEPVGVAGER
jgi:hypothetical protein